MVDTVAGLVLWLGYAVALVGAIMFLIVAFSESVLWGLGCLLLPFVSLVFLILHWRQAKKAFFIELIGCAICFLAVLMGATV